MVVVIHLTTAQRPRTISPDRTESQSQPQLEEEKHNMLADDGANEGALDGICDASDRYSMCGVRQCRQLAEGLQYLAGRRFIDD